MRAAATSSLLIICGCLGCYVEPYTPPPQQAQAQPAQPPPQPQPGYAEQPPPPPPSSSWQGTPTTPPPVAQPAPPPPSSSWQGTPTTPPPAPPPASSWQGAPTTPPPAPTYSGPIYEDVNVEVAGGNVPSIDVFYNDLAPHGSWYNDPTYGWVFAPPSPSYLPYSNGRWVYTDYGYTWVSADPFGWATDHYGRWVWANRWVWRPDTTWGPAWVQWRQGDGYVGWAPTGYTDDAYVPETSWRFVGAASLFAPDVPRYYVTANIGNYLRAAVPVRRYARHRNQTWVAGPDDAWLQRYRVEKRRERADLVQIGRYNDQQRREAERRAHEHQRDWDARRRQDDRVPA